MPPDDNTQKPPVDSTVPATGVPGATSGEPTANVPTDTTTVPPMGAPTSTPTMTPEQTIPGEAPVTEAPTEEEKLPEIPKGPGTQGTGGGTV